MAYGNNSYGGGSGATKAATVEVFGYGSGAYGSEPYSGDATSGAAPVTVDRAALGARSMRTAAAGGVLAPANDDFVARLTMTGTSGAMNFITENATLEGTEPPQFTAGPGTVWWKWTPGYLGTGTVAVPLGMVVDAYLDVDNILADLVPLAGAPTNGVTTTFDVRVGETYAIRVYSTGVNDTFVRANSATGLGVSSDGKITWTTPSGANPIGILSNQAYPVGGSSAGSAALFDGHTPNGTLQVTFNAATSVGGSATLLLFRALDASTNNWRVSATVGTNYALRKVVAGVVTTIGTSTTPFVAGDVVKVVLDGPSIKVYVNGNPVFNITDTDLQTATQYGLRATTTDTASRWSNFSFVPSYGTLTWSVALAPLDFTLATTVIPWSPGTVTAYIANDTPTSTVNLSFDGGATAQTVVTDSEGNVTFPLNIPGIAVGAHTVTATSSSGRTATVSFTVQNADTFTPPTPPTPPAIISGAANRWRFQDPITSETWDFPINPKTEPGTVLPRTLTSHWTTAIDDGQPIIFEGGRKAREWQLTGEVLTLTDLESLRGWKRPYRVYVTDDLERTFVVKVKRVATQPVGASNDVEHPEHHTYTLTALLFGVQT